MDAGNGPFRLDLHIHTGRYSECAARWSLTAERVCGAMAEVRRHLEMLWTQR